MIEPVAGEPSGISKLNTTCQLTFIFFTLDSGHRRLAAANLDYHSGRGGVLYQRSKRFRLRDFLDQAGMVDADHQSGVAGSGLFWLAATAVVGALLYLLAPILTPFVASALLAYVGDPLVDRLQRLRLPRTLAVAIVFLLTFAVLSLLVLLVLPLVRAQIGSLVERLPDYAAWVEVNVLPKLYDLAGAAGSEDVGLSAFLSEYGSVAGSWGTKVMASVSRSGSSLLAGVMALFLVPVLTFYLLRDWDRLVAVVGLLIPVGVVRWCSSWPASQIRCWGGSSAGRSW